MQPIDALRFYDLLTERFPGLDISEHRDSIFLQMTVFARATQACISDESVADVKMHFDFMAEVFRQATSEVQNAIVVSYLEYIGFDGRHARRIKASQMLSPALRAELRALRPGQF